MNFQFPAIPTETLQIICTKSTGIRMLGVSKTAFNTQATSSEQVVYRNEATLSGLT